MKHPDDLTWQDKAWMYYNSNRGERNMPTIECKITEVPRAGHVVFLLACSLCGPVAVDSSPTATPVTVANTHLRDTHGLAGIPA